MSEHWHLSIVRAPGPDGRDLWCGDSFAEVKAVLATYEVAASFQAHRMLNPRTGLRNQGCNKATRMPKQEAL
jgi:hypothetical protein